LADYIGDLKLSSLFNDESGVWAYHVTPLNFTESNWIKNDSIYEYTITNEIYSDLILLAIYNDSFVNIDVKVIKINSNTIKLQYHSAFIGTAIILYKNKDDGVVGTIYPTTKASVVKFGDNQDLETKYQNNTLVDMSKFIDMQVIENNSESYRLRIKIGDNEIITPNLLTVSMESHSTYEYSFDESDTYWKETTYNDNIVYGLTILGTKHLLNKPYVTTVFKIDTDGNQYQLDNLAIQKNGTDITILSENKFSGTVYLKDLYSNTTSTSDIIEPFTVTYDEDGDYSTITKNGEQYIINRDINGNLISIKSPHITYNAIYENGLFMGIEKE